MYKNIYDIWLRKPSFQTNFIDGKNIIIWQNSKHRIFFGNLIGKNAKDLGKINPVEDMKRFFTSVSDDKQRNKKYYYSFIQNQIFSDGREYEVYSTLISKNDIGFCSIKIDINFEVFKFKQSILKTIMNFFQNIPAILFEMKHNDLFVHNCKKIELFKRLNLNEYEFLKQFQSKENYITFEKNNCLISAYKNIFENSWLGIAVNTVGKNILGGFSLNSLKHFNKLYNSLTKFKRLREIIMGVPPSYNGLLRKECINDISFCVQLSISIITVINSEGIILNEVIRLIYKNPEESQNIIKNVFLEAIIIENEENIRNYGYSNELYLSINQACNYIFGMDIYQLQENLKKNNILDVIEYYSSNLKQFSENPISFIQNGGSFSC